MAFNIKYDKEIFICIKEGLFNELNFSTAFLELQKIERKFKKKNFTDKEIEELFIMIKKIIETTIQLKDNKNAVK